MSDRDEMIGKARELDGSATSGPWRHDNVQHQNSVTSIERIITPWGLQFYDAQFIAESRTLLPALADLAESEGRRADDLDAEKRSMREILSELHKMLTRATDAGPCRITDLVQREIHERRAAMAQLAALKGQVDSMRPVVEAVRKMQDARDAMNHGPIGKQEIGPGIRTNGIPGIQGRG